EPRTSSFPPELLPPVLDWRKLFARDRRLRPDVSDRPTGQARQRSHLFLLSALQLGTVACGSLAGISARPRVAQDVAALEVRPVRRLLEDEVLGEVSGVIADLQTREEDVPHSAKAAGSAAASLYPEDTELAELVGRQGVCGARITPAHVPRVFEKHSLHVLPFDGLREHRLVERAELGLDVKWQVHSPGQPPRALGPRLHPPLPGEARHRPGLPPLGR